MNRKCKYLKSSKDNRRAIYVDEENYNEILSYLTRDEKHIDKFRFISEIILGGLRNSTVYDKEEINHKCKGVTAMKFFTGGDNDRIYCKEVHTATGTLIIVACILYEKKKVTKLNNKIISIIEKVGGYNYEV